MKIEEIPAKAGELKTKLSEIKKFWDDNSAVDLKDFTADQKNTIDRLNKEAGELNAELTEAKSYESERALQGVMTDLVGKPQNRPDFGNGERRQEAKTIGQGFTQSEQFKGWLNQIAPNGGAPANFTRIDSPAVDMKGLVYSSATSGGSFVRRDYAPTVDLPLRQLTIRDVISNGRTGSNMIEYVRITGKTRAADVVPEATATSAGGYTAAAKPEAAMSTAIIQETVKTIAVWMPATRQILSDVPQIETLIDNFLRQDLDLALEDQIVSGTGGTDFTGIENTSGVTPQAFSTDALTTTRKARTTSMVVARAKPTAYLLNPYDWEALDLTKAATTGIYYFGGPAQMGIKMLWGLPVVESEAIPQATFYTGDLRQMMVWDREQATTRMTDSHSDFFTHNMIAILTEGRYAFGVFRPAAIVKGDLLAGANS